MDAAEAPAAAPAAVNVAIQSTSPVKQRSSLRDAGAECARFSQSMKAALAARFCNVKAMWRNFTEGYSDACESMDQGAEAARFHSISNRFRFLASLSAAEADLVRHTNYSRRQMHQAGSELAHEGEFVRPTFIASGWACRLKIIDGARRQIVGFLLPGDGIGLREHAEPASSSSIVALTTLETVDATGVVNAAKDQSAAGLREGLTRAAAHDEAFLANQILRLGMLSPAERLLHLLLELRWRLSTVRMGDGRDFPLPLTLETLGEALCIPAGKVRRSLRALRHRKVVKVDFGRAKLLDPVVATDRGPFQPPATCSCARRRMIQDVPPAWSQGVSLR